MEYQCLRNCYVENRLFDKGQTYQLPDDFPKYEKNFKPIEDAPKNELVCVECGRECKSAIGLQSHMRVHQKKEK